MQNLNVRRVFGHDTGGTGGMESAGASLKRMLPALVVSKQKLRRAEGTCMVRMKREEGKQNVGFSSRPFVLCGLPVRKPPTGEMLYERRNGDFVLQTPDIRVTEYRSVKTALCRSIWRRSQYAKEPNNSVPHRCGDAGDLRNAQRWQGVPALGGRF